MASRAHTPPIDKDEDRQGLMMAPLGADRAREVAKAETGPIATGNPGESAEDPLIFAVRRDDSTVFLILYLVLPIAAYCAASIMMTVVNKVRNPQDSVDCGMW